MAVITVFMFPLRDDSKWITIHSGTTNPAIFVTLGEIFDSDMGVLERVFHRADAYRQLGQSWYWRLRTIKLNVAGNVMLEGSDQFLYFTNVGTGNSGIYVRGRT